MHVMVSIDKNCRIQIQLLLYLLVGEFFYYFSRIPAYKIILILRGPGYRNHPQKPIVFLNAANTFLSRHGIIYIIY